MCAYDEVNQNALKAIAAVALELGVEHQGLDVLSARGNLVVRLAGTGIVARAMTRNAMTRREPMAWMAREVMVAKAIAGVGGPVIAPSREVPPGPHEVDGVAITFWTDVIPQAVHPSAADVGAPLLAEFHEVASVAVRQPLPVLTPVHHYIPEALAVLGDNGSIDKETFIRLQDEFVAVVRGLEGAGSPHLVLHGDAHPANLMYDGERWLWFDLEATCLGPPEWDLAVLSLTNPLDGGRAVRRYAETRGISPLAPEDLAPFIRARRLEAAVWSFEMAWHFPDRYRSLAQVRLTKIEGSTSPR